MNYDLERSKTAKKNKKSCHLKNKSGLIEKHQKIKIKDDICRLIGQGAGIKTTSDCTYV